MVAPDPAHDRTWLLVSIAATGAIGAVGVVWGIVGGSQMILLDGVYSIIGIATSALLLGASAVAAAPPTGRYHFGRPGATPLMITIQALVLAATLVYAGAEALLVIVDGGSDVTAGWAVVYGALATVVSASVWVELARRAGTSDVLVAESIAWKVAALRGLGMVAGFTVLGLLTDSRFGGAAPFVDPVMVLVTCVLFLPAPVKMLRGTVGEMLEEAPTTSIRVPVVTAIEAVRDRYELDEPAIRLTKLGQRLYVEVDVTVGPAVTIEQQHEVRTDLQRRLDEIPYDVWLTLEMHPRRSAGPAGDRSE